MFDMNQCKKGDKLVCRDGSIVEYSGICNSIVYPHRVMVKPIGESAWIMSVTSYGHQVIGIDRNNDIIGFYKEEGRQEMIERDKEYDLKVTGEQLAFMFFFLGKTIHYESVYNLYCNLKKYLGVKDELSVKCKLKPLENLIIFKNIEECMEEVFTKPETEKEREKRELLEEYEAAKKHFEELGKKLGVK